MGAFGIPLAYSIASISGALVLLILLKKKVGLYAEGILIFFLKCLVASLVMYAVVILTDSFINTYFIGETFLERLILLGIPCIIGVIVYVFLGTILKIDYITRIIRKTLKRGRANEKSN